MTMTTGNGDIRGCVDHEGKFPLRKGKGPHISVEEGDCGVIGKMGTGVPKPCRITRKDGRPGLQRETVVCSQETLQHPTPKEAGPPGYEKLLVAKGVPLAFRRVTDHFQVGLGKLWHRCGAVCLRRALEVLPPSR